MKSSFKYRSDRKTEKMAQSIRREASKLTPAERKRHLKHGLKIINAGR